MKLKNPNIAGILLVIFTAICCKTTAPVAAPELKNIVGTWEGCDGRKVRFTREPDGSVIGRYTELGGLGRYQFSLNEVGYRLMNTGPGIYRGEVKWRDTRGNVTWKKVEVNIEKDQYFHSDGSDQCSKDMTRIKP